MAGGGGGAGGSPPMVNGAPVSLLQWGASSPDRRGVRGGLGLSGAKPVGRNCAQTGEETQPCPRRNRDLIKSQFCPERRCPPGLSEMVDVFWTCVVPRGGSIGTTWQGALETCLVQPKN